MSKVIRSLFIIAALAAATLASPANAKDIPAELPKPDGKPADMSKPVQVYLLMGQSNAVGMGNVASLEAAVKTKQKYPYLVDEAGNWSERKDVRNVFIMMGKLQGNDWMSVKNRNRVGVEYAIGHLLGNATDAPVMILKNCVGNRSLGYDLLPPSAVGTGAGGKSYEGNKDGTPKDGPWYAGREYDTDVADAKTVLADLDKYYPGAKKYEIAGIFFWQGEKDLGSGGSADNYEVNLVHFIKDLRKSFNAPKALFVCATLGEAKKGIGGAGGKILDAQLAVDGKTGKYPEFKGNVATVYSNPLSHGGSGNGHYGGNAETYMDVGEGMGRAMLELLLENEKKPQGDGDSKDASALADVEKLVAEKQYLEAVTALRRLTVTKGGTDIAKQAADRLKALQDDPAIGRLIIDAEADAFEGRCAAAQKEKDYVLAIKLYEQYVGQFPKASRCAKVKATLEALKSDKAIQLAVKNAQADADCKGWMSLADNYAKAGMNEKAREYLTKIVDKYGDTEWGAKARDRLAKIPGD